jgi:GntR family transcriptional regulator
LKDSKNERDVKKKSNFILSAQTLGKLSYVLHKIGRMQTAPSFSPLYQQIKALILQSLQAGEWRPAEAIPSEMELAARYGVSQGTVRKAIDELSSEKLLVRRQGKGTFVATHTARQVQTRFLRLVPDSADEGGSDTYAENGKQILVERTITACNRQRASGELAKALNLKTGDSVVYIQRVLAYKKGSGETIPAIPTILEDIWLSGAPFKGLNLERLAESKAPMYAMFEAEFGVSMVRATEEIRAVNPTAQEAKLLQVNTSAPLLSVERVAYTYNDQPIEVRRGLYRTDSRHYRNELV